MKQIALPLVAVLFSTIMAGAQSTLTPDATRPPDATVPESTPSSGLWTLQGTVGYARDHNLDVQQAIVNQRGAGWILTQSQLAQLPSISFNTAAGRAIGTSIDPTTNQFTSQGYNFLTFSGQANVLVFGWFQQRNTIIKNKLALQAAQYDVQQRKDEVMWTVTTAFLRVLLNWEQMKVNEAQIAISKAQVSQAAKFAKAGAAPDLHVAQMQAQLASDSSTFILSQSEVNAAIVDMKTLLNLPQNQAFTVTPPDADELAAQGMALSDPEEIYQVASGRLGIVKASDLRIQAAQKNLAVAKAALLPQLSVNAQFITAASDRARRNEVVGSRDAAVDNYYIVGPNGQPQSIYATSPVYEQQRIGFGEQITNNYRTLATVNLTLPLFNGWASNYNVRQARIAVEQAHLTQDQTALKLRESVYKAYNDARNSVQTYIAAKRATAAAQKAFGYAEARSTVGLTNMSEYLAILNTAYIAKSKMLSAKYDMFFKMKLIDFYMGKELRL